jgi:serine/threonine protein kinase
MSGSTFNLGNKFRLIKKIGSGSFGEVFMVQDLQDKNLFYAAKIEDNTNHLKLKDEYIIYKKLNKNGNIVGIPKIKTYIETPKCNAMVMELLGNGLDHYFEKFGGKFDLRTTLTIGINCINLLHQVHSLGIIHRDIKPNNFVVGKFDINTVHIIDFGLSKQYIVKDQHIGMKCERSLVGTPRYSSINVHMGFEPSRRDDLEAVGYMLIYFLKGKLPWQGVKKQKGIEHSKTIGNIKIYTSLQKLCDGIPNCFIEYLKYCRLLEFEETPNYDLLTSLFMQCLSDNSLRLGYCWNSIDLTDH